MNAEDVISATSEEISPAVLASLRGLARLLSRPWVRAIVRVVLYLTLGGLPMWIIAAIDFLLQLSPTLHPAVVQDLHKFRSVLASLRADMPNDLAPMVKTSSSPAILFRSPEHAEMAYRAVGDILVKRDPS